MEKDKSSSYQVEKLAASKAENIAFSCTRKGQENMKLGAQEAPRMRENHQKHLAQIQSQTQTQTQTQKV